MNHAAVVTLPSFATLVSPMSSELPYQHPSDPPWSPVPSVPRPSFDRPAVSSTRPTPLRPPLDSKWTAINRPTSAAAPAPASRYHSAAAAAASNAYLASSSASLASPASESGRNGQSTHHVQFPASPASSRLAVAAVDLNRSSPPRNPKPEPAATPKPIAARRQDSAVPEPTASHLSLASRAPPSGSTVYLARNSNASRPPSLAPDAVAGPKTPLSPALTSPTFPVHPTKHERLRESPPETLDTRPSLLMTPIRPRASSDSKLSPSSQPTSSACSPLHPRAVESSARERMPPPANPASATSAGASSQVLDNGSASASPSAAAAPSNHSSASDSNRRDPSCRGSSSSLHRAGAFSFTYPPPQRDRYSDGQCLICGERWEAPPIDPTLLRERVGDPTLLKERVGDPTFPERVRKLLAHLAARTLTIAEFMDQYRKAKDQDYEEWVRKHQVEPGGPEPSVSCLPQRHDTSDDTSPNNKRKSDVIDDERSCQLTPPPDPPYSSSPTHLSTTHRNTFCIPSARDIKVSAHMAIILGLDGAPPPVRGGSPKDSTSMFHLPERCSKSADRKKARSSSPRS